MAVLDKPFAEFSPSAATSETLSFKYSAVIIRDTIQDIDAFNCALELSDSPEVEPDALDVLRDHFDVDGVNRAIREWGKSNVIRISDLADSFKAPHSSTEHFDSVLELPFALSIAAHRTADWLCQRFETLADPNDLTAKKIEDDALFRVDEPIDSFTQNPGDAVFVPGFTLHQIKGQTLDRRARIYHPWYIGAIPLSTLLGLRESPTSEQS